jgi:hypothetical protein
MGLEGADSSNVILGGPEILFGRIEKIEGNDFLVYGDHGQFMKLQLTKNTNIVCSRGQKAQLMTGRQDMQEQAEIPISPATEEQMKSHDPSRLDDQLNFLNDPNRQQAEFETPEPSLDRLLKASSDRLTQARIKIWLVVRDSLSEARIALSQAIMSVPKRQM